MNAVTDFKEENFQDMRDRTEAYFKKYVEIADGEWTVVIPEEDFALTAGNHAKLEGKK